MDLIILPKTIFILLKWLASGLGSGWLPKAPGTWGSLAALFPAWWMLFYFDNQMLALATLLVTALGLMVCYFLLPKLVALGEHHDPGWIVIDEWAGLWLCITLIQAVYPHIDMVLLLTISFVLFRGFDILKPYPIKHVETWGPDWFSIMHDDLIAGLMGALVGILVIYVAG